MALPNIDLFVNSEQIPEDSTSTIFEGLLLGMERSVTLTLKNTGSAILDFDTNPVRITGDQASLITLTSGPEDTSLEVGEETTVTLTMEATEPTGGGSAGKGLTTIGANGIVLTCLKRSTSLI